MRIDLDTDNLTMSEIDELMHKLHLISDRKQKAKQVQEEMDILLTRAYQEGFYFTVNNYENFICPDNITIHDEKNEKVSRH